MAQYRRSEIVSGGFIVASAVVFTLFAFGVGELDTVIRGWFGGGKRTFQTVLADIQTLEEGAKVAIGGRRVGSVTKITLATSDIIRGFHEDFGAAWNVPFKTYAEEYRNEENEDLYAEDAPPRVLVEFEVDEEDVGDLKVNGKVARALLMQEGFLGPHYIQIHLGPEGERQLEAKAVFGDDLKVENVPLVGVNAGLMAQAKPLIDGLKKAMGKINEQLLGEANLAVFEKILAEVQGLVVDARRLVNADVSPLFNPDNQLGLYQTLLKPGNELLVGANATMGRLEQDVRAKIINNLEATILEGKTTLAVAKETLETVQTDLKIATPKLQKILDNLRDGTNQLDVRLNNLEAQVDKVVVEVVDLLQEGNKLVTDLRPETLESLKGLRRSVWEMEMALKKIRANPAVVLWGDDEKILSTWPTDPAKRRRSGRAAPYEQRDEDEKK